ncbi:MAG: fatty acid desaturase [Gemmatimonadales bacterium]
MTCHPTFPPDQGGAFLVDVKAAVNRYFQERRLSPHADSGMVVKSVVMLSLIFVPYGLILSGALSGPVMLGLCVVIGIGMAGTGFAVAHDALHGAYSKSPRVNRVLGFCLDLIGGSSYMWKITHNIIHHTYTNIHGTDEDLSVSPLLRLSPHAPRRWYHRYQHYYAFLLYAMTTLFWVFVKDYQQLFRRDLGPYANRKHKASDVAGLIAGKLVYYGWSVVIPFIVIQRPVWQIAAGMLVAHLVAGTTLGIVFQLAHVVEETAHPEPDEVGAMPRHWAAHEMETTANFAPSNRLLGWYVGGLNYQVEHHLFPRVCSVHYPEVSRIVRQLAGEYNLPYHSHPTFRSSVRSHLRTLKRYGRTDPVPARVADPVSAEMSIPVAG